KPKVADQILNILLEQESIQQINDLIKINGFEIVYTKEQHIIKSYILKKLESAEYLPPRKDDLALELKTEKEEVEEVLNALINDNTITKINEDVYLLTNSYNKALDFLKEHFKENVSIT